MTVSIGIAALFFAACSSGPATCDEVADEFVEVAQALIDDVETEVGDASIDDILSAEGGLPNIESFNAELEKLDERADELDCTTSQMEALVADRASQLRATTPIGNIIIEFFATGEL